MSTTFMIKKVQAIRGLRCICMYVIMHLMKERLFKKSQLFIVDFSVFLYADQ